MTLILNKVFLKKPYLLTRGAQNILDDLERTEPKAKGLSGSSMIENRFLKELDESGFIDRLYQ